MSGHTPGPWALDSGETCGIRDSEGGRLALCTFLRGPHGDGGRRNHDEVVANARLIAAAPNLLAKVREVAAACAGCHGTGAVLYRGGSGNVGDPCPDCADLRDLIAEAT